MTYRSQPHIGAVKFRAPGTWKPIFLEDGCITASFSCPLCGQLGSLDDHLIQEDGSVTPSLICPSDRKCTFHDNVVLVGWTGPKKAVENLK